MVERADLHPRAIRDLLGEGDDPDATLDVRRAQRMGGVFWLFGALSVLVLLPFAPPDEIGWPGWVVVALGLAGAALIARRRLDDKSIPDLNEIYWSGWVALAFLVLLEWLAGGRLAPYHHLFVLPTLYAAAIHGTRRSMAFLVGVALALCLPLLYDRPFSGEAAVDVGAQLLMLLALALTSRALFKTVRTQRGHLLRAREEAEQRARRDPLTDLGNRLAFQESVAREVARAQRSNTGLSVVLGDLEDFKRINDTFGHVRGDECLRAVAMTIAAAARRGEECFRWGGDEFAVLLPGASSDEARQALDRFCNRVRRECTAPDGLPIKLVCATTSMAEGQEVNSLVASVDRALIDLKTGPSHARRR